MALVLVHDLLFTKRGIQSSDGPLKQAVMRHKARLKAELVKYKIKAGAKSNEDLVSQKVKDAGMCVGYHFTDRTSYFFNIYVSSSDTALCSCECSQDQCRKGYSCVYQGGIHI